MNQEAFCNNFGLSFIYSTMPRLSLFILVLFYSSCLYGQTTYTTNVKCGLSARKFINGEPGNTFDLISDSQYNIYYIPAYYKDDIAINYNVHGCGGQAADLWDARWVNETNRGEFIKPVEFTWTGPDIYEKGFIQFYDQNCIYGGRGCTKEAFSIPNPYTPEEGDDFFHPYLKIKAPTKTTEYTLTYSKRYTDPNGNVSIYTATGKVVLVIGQSVPTGIKHYRQLSNNPMFSTPTLLSENAFSVCADASEASLFGMKLNDEGLKKENLGIRIKENTTGNEELYGKLSPLTYIGTDSMTVRYKHPNHLENPTNSLKLTLEIYLLDDPSFAVESFPLTVYRAPLLMVHGLWSNPDVFTKLERQLQYADIYPYPYYASAPMLTKRADYSGTNSASFAENVPKIKAEIDGLIQELGQTHVAAGAVDYIGHSMGGILGRMYLQGDTYQTGIHKLITLNTPHSGSQIANIMADAKIVLPTSMHYLCTTLIPLFSEAATQACEGGALDNLRVDSPEITGTLNGLRRNYRTVPSHTVVTVEYQTPKEILDGLFEAIANEFNPLSPGAKNIIKGIGKYTFKDVLPHMMLDVGTSLIFGGLNDAIVSQVSQQGGMTGSCTSLIENQAHCGSPENDEVIEQIKALLLAATGSSSFCQYFNPINIGKPTVPLIIPSGTIAVISPKPGQFIRGGTTAAVRVSGTDLTDIKVLVEYSSAEIVTARSVGTAGIYTTPISNEEGRRKVIVIGKTTAGGYVADTSWFYINNHLCESIQSGDWSASATWSCGHEPTVTDVVIIQAGHTVTVSTDAAQALQINYYGGILKFSNPNAKISIKGSD